MPFEAYRHLDLHSLKASDPYDHNIKPEDVAELCRGVQLIQKSKLLNKKAIEKVGKWKKTLELLEKEINNTPVSNLLGEWAQEKNKDQKYGPLYLSLIEEVISLCKLGDSRLKLGDLKNNKILDYMEEIRCHDRWSVAKREAAVKVLCDFWDYLTVSVNHEIFLVPGPYDVERRVSSDKKLPFETFIKIINCLNLRERVIAQLLYYADDVTQKDVLSIEISDVFWNIQSIDFKNTIKKFAYGTKRIYPKHVIQDLKKFINGRKSGFVFIGKGGVPIDPTVPYRALKKVSNKLNLEKNFSFKNFSETR